MFFVVGTFLLGFSEWCLYLYRKEGNGIYLHWQDMFQAIPYRYKRIKGTIMNSINMRHNMNRL